MRKEELRKLKRINATTKTVELSKNNNKKMRYKSKWSDSYTERNTEYDMLIRCQTRGKILMVCVFFPKKVAAGERTPTYEIYCNAEGDEYITRIMEKGKEQKWSGAMADNLGSIRNSMRWYSNYKNTDRRIWENPEGKGIIQKFLGTRRKGLYGLIEWQRDVKHRNTIEAEKRQKAPWDADMKLIPPVMAGFKEWMLTEAVREYFIFYEYSRSGTKTGYCSHCRRDVPIEQPKHNKKGRCPCCKAEIQYKVSSRIQTLRTTEYKGEVIQKIKGGVVIRSFYQRQWYRDTDYRAPKDNLNEYERILLMENGTVKRYYFGPYKNKEYRWILDKNYIPYRRSYYYRREKKLYSRNLTRLKKTALKNSAIDLWDELPADTASYLVLEKGNPAIEKLARIGMFNLAKDLLEARYQNNLLREDASELTKILKIDTGRLKRLKAVNGGIYHLKWYQYEKLVNRMWPDEMIKDFGNCKFETSAFNFLPAPHSYVKIWNYLKKQSEMCGESMARVRDTWDDYMNMAQKAKLNTRSEMIYRPKDLKQAHNEVVMILQSGAMEKQAEMLEKKWPEVNKILPRLQKYEYSDGKYTILAPKGIIDIVKEGTALQHCVHTCDFYFDRIQRDESYLFFLRKTDSVDVPWYTLEVEPSGNIRQKRTTGDNQNKDFEDAVKFLKKWQKEFKKRMTKEEKELGVRADQARQEEYAKLRKDGNRVWHGKLAGQLLADVLEKDFMAAVM